MASSVKECIDSKASSLDLSSYEFDTIPEELRSKALEKFLRVLNLTSNPLRQLEPRDHYLPVSLRELHLSGCGLKTLPDNLTRLIKLQRFFAGANFISNADVLFKLTSLQHAGLSYNSIATLPKALLPACTSLLSLDISHNNFESLNQTFSCIQALPSLQVLGLQGNPICLLPNFVQRLHEDLAPKLAYLNGQKLDAMFASRPPGASSQYSMSQSSFHSRQAAAPTGQHVDASKAAKLSATGPYGEPMSGFENSDTTISIELRDLSLKGQDPFAPLQQLWADELAAAQEAVQPVTFTMLPPPQPVVYYFELHSCEEPMHYEGARKGSARQQHQHPESSSSHGSTMQRQWCDVGGSTNQGVDGFEGMQGGHMHPPPSPFSNQMRHGFQARGEWQQQEEGLHAANVQENGGDRELAEAGQKEQEELSVGSPLQSAASVLKKEVNECSLHGSTTLLASVPLILQPPEPPVLEPDVAPKGKGAASKNKPPPPKPPLKAVKAGNKGEVQEEGPKLERGYLLAVLPLHANVSCRNWLRNGIQVRLFCTQLEAVIKPEAVEQELEAQKEQPPPSKGKGKGRPTSSDKGKDRPRSGRASKDVQESPAVNMSKYDVIPHTNLLGLGTLRAGSMLLKGGINTVTETLSFTPEPALWDAKGMRMALEDPRHSSEPVAQVEATLSLHAPQNPLPVLPLSTPSDKSGRKSPKL